MEIAKIENGDLKGEVKFEKGEIVALSSVNSAGLKAELKVVIPSDYFLDQLAAKIPGTIDDQLLGLIKMALKAV